LKHRNREMVFVIPVVKESLERCEGIIMEVIIEVLERYLEKWKDILRLRDWDIIIEIVEGKWRKSGDIKVDIEDKKV